MEQWEIAKLLLCGDRKFEVCWEVYHEVVHKGRELQRWRNIDLEDLDKQRLHEVLHKASYCKRMIKLIRRQPFDCFQINTKVFYDVSDKIRIELNRRTAISLAKPSAREIRQMKAKQNKSHKRGKNR